VGLVAAEVRGVFVDDDELLSLCIGGSWMARAVYLYHYLVMAPPLI